MTATVTWNIPPEYEYVLDQQRDCLTTGVEQGVIFARQINQRAMKVYKLVWETLPSQVIPLIRYLYDLTGGGVEPMNYTPFGESAIEVRFASNTLTTIDNSATSGAVAIELEQVF